MHYGRCPIPLFPQLEKTLIQPSIFFVSTATLEQQLFLGILVRFIAQYLFQVYGVLSPLQHCGGNSRHWSWICDLWSYTSHWTCCIWVTCCRGRCHRVRHSLNCDRGFQGIWPGCFRHLGWLTLVEHRWNLRLVIPIVRLDWLFSQLSVWRLLLVMCA